MVPPRPSQSSSTPSAAEPNDVAHPSKVGWSAPDAHARRPEALAPELVIVVHRPRVAAQHPPAGIGDETDVLPEQPDGERFRRLEPAEIEPVQRCLQLRVGEIAERSVHRHPVRMAERRLLVLTIPPALRASDRRSGRHEDA